jgi:hypothetical protein
MGTSIEINMQLIKALDAIPLTLRSGPFQRCMDQFGKTVAKAVPSKARTSRGGSRKRWSRKYKDNPAFQNDSRDHFSHKVLQSGLAVYVGATYPQGNKQQFVMPIKQGPSYQRFLWGKPGQQVQRVSKLGKTYTTTVNTKPQTANFPIHDRATVRGYDLAKTQAEQAFLSQLQKEIRSLKLG